MDKKPWWRDKKLILLGVLALCGILLLSLGGRVGTSDRTSSGTVVQTGQSQALDSYSKQLRREIAELCEQVDGVSDVTVAVSFDCGYEYVYAADTRSEYDAGGGQLQIKYVTVGNGSSEKTVYLTEKLPHICGIGVVCRGGEDPEVVRKLTLLLSAAYNIGSNKIYVTGT